MGVDISEPLRALLEAKRLTQEQLGERAGIKRTDINLIASGRPVGPVRLRRIADALEVDVTDLEGTAQPAAPKNPLLAHLAEIKEALADMNRQRDEFRADLNLQLSSQTGLLSELGVTQARLDKTAEALVSAAEHLHRASAALERQATRRRPA